MKVVVQPIDILHQVYEASETYFADFFARYEEVDTDSMSEEEAMDWFVTVSYTHLNLALLFFFKYWDFIAGSLRSVGIGFMPTLALSLPLGISFYTFQTMSYTIDVYRGDARAQRNIVNFGTFVTLFPQLIAGPIIKYKDLDDQIDHRTCLLYTSRCV